MISCRSRRVGMSEAVWLVVAVALTSCAAAGQQEAPVFRAGVRLIDVDVVVTDRDGKPVREIVEDGRTQEVRTFSLVDLPVRDAASAGSAPPS